MFLRDIVNCFMTCIKIQLQMEKTVNTNIQKGIHNVRMKPIGFQVMYLSHNETNTE